MNKELSPPVIKAVITMTILLVLISANSIMNYSYAITKNTPIQNESNLPMPAPTPPRLLGTLEVVTKVLGSNNKPSDFTITVSGKNPSPRTFSGSPSGTTVTLKPGKYSVLVSYLPGYTTTYSSGCSGSISGGKKINSCTVTNRYTPPLGSTTFLSVVTKVDNTNGGTKKPSDFTITVSGNSPRPRIFSGSSSGISIGLKAGIYRVVVSHIPDYTATYSSGCSGTASGGVPIKCIITNQYYSKPAPPPLPNNPINTTITSDSNSVYSIPSTFVKVDRFSTNYTIAGKISSINASRDLITSAIIDDFDKNSNIGYVVSNSSSLNIVSQPSLPNPFVSKDTINQKITNETQNAITAVSETNPTEKSIKIKCAFGMILADYKCY